MEAGLFWNHLNISKFSLYMRYHILPPRRFYSLDIIRGVAALSIVLWHWQHFFSPLNKQRVLLSIDKLPLFNALFIFYKHGDSAVQLFFCLSGFIFFWLYSKRIAEKTITLRYFSVLKLSRLYPLHFITLIVVAVGQLIYINVTKYYFIYQYNDIYHFFLNLFFASSWGLEKGSSFNGPIWSVSVEVILYLTFFVFCLIFHRNIINVLFAIIIGVVLGNNFNYFIGMGVECFFIGGFVFIVYEHIIKTGDTWKVSIWLPVAASIAWLVTIGAISPNYGFTHIGPSWLLKMKMIISVWAAFVLFPLTIMSLALIETKRGTLGKRLSIVGDISYSSYLLHFPLQLIVVTVTAKLAINQQLFYAHWFMALFFFVLIIMSFASHRYFEVPIQRFLRLQLNPKVGTNAAQ